MLARQSNDIEAALGQAGVQATYVFARRTKQDSRFGLMQTQQVHNRILNVRWSDRYNLIADVAMAAVFANGRDAQGVLLVTLGKRHDWLRHSRREKQSAAAFGRRVQYFFEFLAETHVEHFVSFVENRDLQCGQVKCATLQVIAQTAGRSDDDLCALIEGATFFRRVHAANAGRDANASLGIKPHEFAADLQGKFARWRDDECGGFARKADQSTIKDLRCHSQAKSNGFA